MDVRIYTHVVMVLECVVVDACISYISEYIVVSSHLVVPL